jgi:hypothetical protein
MTVAKEEQKDHPGGVPGGASAALARSRRPSPGATTCQLYLPAMIAGIPALSVRVCIAEVSTTASSLPGGTPTVHRGDSTEDRSAIVANCLDYLSCDRRHTHGKDAPPRGSCLSCPTDVQTQAVTMSRPPGQPARHTNE